ncbi:leucyl/phenylalanyl-tRNA--protein transferase [Hydrogenophaga sp. RWCD_12]|uniref:leucyl/phenylalanyl-tRNA--protein transferase n=1 Tax=Hydrogenophaga sp. RWCD_12 TaxID=3391190 RepID=UPI00398556FF
MSTTPTFGQKLPWLEPGDRFPSVEQAWGEQAPAPGLLAAGGDLSVASLTDAYRHGIFPWYGAGQPILWWSTDPRMVLRPQAFRFHRSLRKSIQKLRSDQRLDIRFDHDFERVIRACANASRKGQSGTWILPAMVQAYIRLHKAGFAHSVETWVDGELVGGLYCVNVGAMVFGESMFSLRSDASKMALSALVAFCLASGIPLIDCQQDTPHLTSMGASLMPRHAFCEHLRQTVAHRPPAWKFEPVYWNQLIPDDDARA